MTIKELFDKSENGSLDYSTFEKLMNENGAKFADLSEGKYVSKDKYENEVASKDSQITKLNDTIKEREKDLKNLNTQLKDAGTDSEKLAELQTQFGNLQTQYKTDTDNYKAQLSKQAYEFAVKEFASGKKFTSNAAKRDFISSMIAKELKMEGDKILGADDFVTSYSTENADAFITEKAPEQNTQTPPPTFSKTVNPNTQQPQMGDNPFGFHFSQVRPKPNNM
jgi:myosin heavy subunit